MKTFSVLLPDELYEPLRTLAQDTERSIGCLIRAAIERMLKEIT